MAFKLDWTSHPFRVYVFVYLCVCVCVCKGHWAFNFSPLITYFSVLHHSARSSLFSLRKMSSSMVVYICSIFAAFVINTFGPNEAFCFLWWEHEYRIITSEYLQWYRCSGASSVFFVSLVAVSSTTCLAVRCSIPLFKCALLVQKILAVYTVEFN